MMDTIEFANNMVLANEIEVLRLLSQFDYSKFLHPWRLHFHILRSNDAYQALH